MNKVAKYSSVEMYFESQPKETLITLLALREILQNTIPDCEELLNYEMPAYTLVKGAKRDKQIMIAGYKKFVGFYVGNNVLSNFANELEKYVVGKASVQFPIGQALPTELIIKIIKHKLNLIQ